MPLIPPMGDAYIDEIIKAVDPFDPSLNKTQGTKLRELIKLMRDRMEQGVIQSVALQQAYTVVNDFNIVVYPANYFDQPTTFIADRNSGQDVVISFENYSGEDNQGKVYHIKNMGLKPVVIVSASGALFDGQSAIMLPQYDSVSIMSLNLLEDSGTTSMWAILCNERKVADDVRKILTLDINGLPENVEVKVNGVVWPNREKSFSVGTILSSITPTIDGWVLDPLSINDVVMDIDRTLTFNATVIAPIDLLPGASYMTLPGGDFTEGPDNVFISGVDETRVMLNVTLPDEGYIGLKYVPGIAMGEMMLCEINDIAGQFVGFYIIGNDVYWEVRNGGSAVAGNVIDGMFVVLRKTSANILLQTTTDGISFTTIHDFGALDYKYVRLYAGSLSSYYYPQGLGLSVLEYEFSPTVTWGDEFTANGSPDSNMWGLDEGNGYYGWGNAEQQYYTNRTDNALISEGTLKITAKIESYNGFNYTSAKLNTREKRMFQFGRFEISAKLPATGGMWPAIFMFGEDHQWFNLQSWPDCGEIDVMEFNGNNPTIIHDSIHCGYYNYGNGRPRFNQTSIQNPQEFNNYRIDWTPDYIRWFINDVQSYEFLNDGGDHSHWPFNDWFNLIISLSVGGNFVGPVDQEALPQSYEIGHVRYYELLGNYNTPPKVKPAAPSVPVTEATKYENESFTFHITDKPANTTIKWYAYGTFVVEGDSVTFPTETPLGIYTGACVTVDNSTGIASEAVPIRLENLPVP
jgi:beta-glucanase (GH16 family)